MNRDEAKAKIQERFKGKGVSAKRWTNRGSSDGYGLEVFFLEPSTTRFDKGLGVEVRLTKMYSFYEEPFDFDDMQFLSELLGTKKINVDQEQESSGCETCDYGSRYRCSLFASNVTTVD